MSRGFGGIVKQAQAMQQKMAKMQEEMELLRIESSVGGGVVSAVGYWSPEAGVAED